METGYKLFKKKYLSAEMLKEKSFGIEPEITIKLAKQINAVALNPNKEFITKEIVNKIHSKNIKVYPYTINTPRNIRKMRSMGVDAIITDYPERIKR